MEINAEMIKLIDREQRGFAQVKETSHFYLDLNFDSLSFIKFLVQVEELYAITFALWEMEKCLQVGGLIALVKEKVAKGRAAD